MNFALRIRAKPQRCRHVGCEVELSSRVQASQIRGGSPISRTVDCRHGINKPLPPSAAYGSVPTLHTTSHRALNPLSKVRVERSV